MTTLAVSASRSDHCGDPGRFFRVVMLLGGIAPELGYESWSAGLHLVN